MENDQVPELQGYCPVGYHFADEALPGNPEITVVHDAKLYCFVNEDAKAEFEKDPARYLPAFDGKCAFGVSIEKEFEPCPENFKIIDGTLHLFVKNEDTDALALWNKEEPKCIANANKNWRAQHA